MEAASFAEQLHAQGYRMTPQRWAILSIIQASPGHLTPATIFHRAQQILPGLTEATVYRTLDFLNAQGLILAAHIGSGQLVYEFGGHAHHHLICRSCASELEIDHAFLQELYKVFEERTGYRIDSVHTTFFGYCPGCQK